MPLHLCFKNIDIFILLWCHSWYILLKCNPYRKIFPAIYNMPGLVSINFLTNKSPETIRRGWLNLKASCNWSVKKVTWIILNYSPQIFGVTIFPIIINNAKLKKEHMNNSCNILLILHMEQWWSQTYHANLIVYTIWYIVYNAPINCNYRYQ